MRIDQHRYRKVLEDLLAAGGVDSAQAENVVDNLTWCDMAGRRNHGIERLPILLKRVGTGAIKCPCNPQISRLAPAVGRINADCGFGHHAAKLGMNLACELAAETGIGTVGVHNSNFLGAGAYYVQLAADRGMIGIALSNSFPKVAAHDGIKPVLGTNPLAFSAPRADGLSIIVDMSTAAMAGSSVREAIAKDHMLEPGLAINANGAPILVPALAAAGTLLPAAGAKGFGLAILVELLSAVLTGAGVAQEVASMYADLDRPGNNGHLLLAIDISRWMPIEQFHHRVETLASMLTTPTGSENVRLPGDARWAEIARSEREGILIEDHILRQIEQLADSLGVALDWR
ncbi:MAG: Ldh family oxidoreductase [Sphingomonadales bacterium]|jgi:ureidoglycolate dehydrogenase (NAD+)|nr:Ldh family oxidoreductase [Sphingomonadales bacterium]MBK9002818.1 Ldh family oxidoreductase [Sphingomonadales bacterium]MBK9268043.1 Ldh family oxidoreductase [Sphingomonadales bacterium]